MKLIPLLKALAFCNDVRNELFKFVQNEDILWSEVELYLKNLAEDKNINQNAKTPVITPTKPKRSDQNFQALEKNESEVKDGLSPYLKKSVISVAKESNTKENLNERNTKKEIDKKQHSEARNHSVYRYKNTDPKLEKVENIRKITDNLTPIKEEENEKEKKSVLINGINRERTPEKILEKVSPIMSKLEIGRNHNEIKPNTSSKNSNSSNNNNNETSDSLNRTSSNKLNLLHLVPIPNKDKNSKKIVHLNTINCDDNPSTLEKELLGNSIKRNSINKAKKNFSTPETQSKNSEREPSRLNSFNQEETEKKTSTPIPTHEKSKFNSGKVLDLNISLNTPSKKTSFDDEHKDDESEASNTIKPLEAFNIEDYKIISNIGEGSFGVIYSAENQISKEKFAMKKIIVNNDEDLKLFMNEFELVNRFPHKNILKIFGLCSKVLDFSTKVLYIQMELAITDWDKEIKNRFKTNSFYKENEIILILKQIVQSLSFLQEKGISHRDVKPQNILIFPENIYKVADFGEAKEMKISNKQLETLRGTELYMSPILFTTLRNTSKNNVQHNTYKSDVFSLGYCILYAATLSFKVLYDIRHVNNQKNVINTIKTYLGKKYSSTFIEMVCSMVDVNESQRFDFAMLNKHLRDNF